MRAALEPSSTVNARVLRDPGAGFSHRRTHSFTALARGICTDKESGGEIAESSERLRQIQRTGVRPPRTASGQRVPKCRRRARPLGARRTAILARLQRCVDKRQDSTRRALTESHAATRRRHLPRGSTLGSLGSEPEVRRILVGHAFCIRTPPTKQIATTARLAQPHLPLVSLQASRRAVRGSVGLAGLCDSSVTSSPSLLAVSFRSPSDPRALGAQHSRRHGGNAQCPVSNCVLNILPLRPLAASHSSKPADFASLFALTLCVTPNPRRSVTTRPLNRAISPFPASLPAPTPHHAAPFLV